MQAFQFKQFVVEQDKSAMKIGTDSILLGSWCKLNTNVDSVLDIGAGTGILSLMLAQQSNAEIIDAVEIEDKAYEQCVENFENSPWNNKLFCYHASFEEFVNEMDNTYDFIISNPPYHSETIKTNNKQRNLARFNSELSFKTLLEGVSKLLSKQGEFSVIIPFKEEQLFLNEAKKVKLHPNKICYVKGTSTSKIKRCLINFRFQNKTTQTSEIIIENKRHQYTTGFINLTKEFYLNF